MSTVNSVSSAKSSTTSDPSINSSTGQSHGTTALPDHLDRPRSSERVVEMMDDKDFVDVDFSFDDAVHKVTAVGAIAGWKPGHPKRK